MSYIKSAIANIFLVTYFFVIIFYKAVENRQVDEKSIKNTLKGDIIMNSKPLAWRCSKSTLYAPTFN